MNTTRIGRNAERLVAVHLLRRGYRIIARNWRTKRCEIDLIVQRADVMYFVEVKFRRTTMNGDGLNYITAQKLQQMQYAAETWIARCGWQGNVALVAANVDSDSNIEIIELF